MFNAFLLAIIANIAEARLSSSDIESKILRNEISLQQSPIFKVNSAIMDKMIALQKNKYANFKDNMMFYHSFSRDGELYTVSYDWTADLCKLAVFKEDEMQANKITGLSERSGKVVDDFSQTISVKVCEKLYNFYSK